MSTARAIALLQEAIAVLSGQVNAPATQAGVDAAAAQYLRDNADVAKHIYFSKHPLEHYQVHGQAEGRKWPSYGTSEPVSPETVTTPGGRQFPAPDPRENGMGYIQRVGAYLGKGAEWARVAGTLFLGSDHLVPKSVKYPDDYAAWKSDPRNWPTMAENFWFAPSQPVDPGWQQVHDRMQEQRGEKPAAPVTPQLPPGEEPL